MRAFLIRDEKPWGDKTVTIKELILFLSGFDSDMLVVGGWESQLKPINLSISECLKNKNTIETVLCLSVD